MKHGFIFDLDGVIVDTAKYHYLAWKELAGELGFDFPIHYNERQKGVSRMASLEVVLEAGGIEGLTREEKEALAERKNKRYLEMIERLDASHILPGMEEFLKQIRKDGCLTALGSASKSGEMILEKLGLRSYFDVIVDGRLVSKAKPDPEVFLTAARLLGLPSECCIVVEDAKAGIEAARAGSMHCIGIGEEEELGAADKVFKNTAQLITYDYASLLSKA